MGKEFIKVKLLFFAAARELAGVEECEIELPEKITYTTLLETFNVDYNLASLKNRFLIALNSQQLDSKSNELIELSENCDIAVIPPISGG